MFFVVRANKPSAVDGYYSHRIVIGYVEEMYNGQTVVQTFHYQERAKKEFARLNDALKTSSRKAETTAGAVSPITTRLCWNIPGVLRSRFLLLQE